MDERVRLMVFEYVVDVFAEALGVPAADLLDLDANADLDITSVQNLTIVAKLDEDLGDIPVTLLFDRPRPIDVVAYLVDDRAAETASWVASRPRGTSSWT